MVIIGSIGRREDAFVGKGGGVAPATPSANRRHPSSGRRGVLGALGAEHSGNCYVCEALTNGARI